ncbi:CHAD domain-containing protein [Streptomyces sp. NPDC052012]|uniref:CHAD domain-containing protein n=1 Tax=Streptomyces sp. NPDC052012 TaxID=3155051 RepID=UPI00344F199D
MAQQHLDPTDPSAQQVPADALVRYLRAQATEFLRALRLHRETGAGAAGSESSVEAARALRRSARRISGTLHTFQPLLDPDWSESMRPELAWVSGTLALEHAYASRLDRLLQALQRLSGAPVLPPQGVGAVRVRPVSDGTATPAGATSGRAGTADARIDTVTGSDSPGRTTGTGRTSGRPGPGTDGFLGAETADDRLGTAAGTASRRTGGPADRSPRAADPAAAGGAPGASDGVAPADGVPGGDAPAAATASQSAARRAVGAPDGPVRGARTASALRTHRPDEATSRTEPAPDPTAGTTRPTAGTTRPATGTARSAAGAPRTATAPTGGANLTVGAAKAGALLDRQLTLARTRAHSTALQALGSSRFHAIADKVAVLASEVPLAPAAGGADLRPLAQAARERLADAIAALPLVTAGSPYNAEALIHGLSPDPAPHPQDAPWHQVRLLLRLHRYAREVLYAAHDRTDGEPPVDLRLLAAGEALDRHRDASEAAAAAAQAARTPRIAPATAYALGVLHADQRHEVEAARYAFQRSWQKEQKEAIGTL